MFLAMLNLFVPLTLAEPSQAVQDALANMRDAHRWAIGHCAQSTGHLITEEEIMARMGVLGPYVDAAAMELNLNTKDDYLMQTMTWAFSKIRLLTLEQRDKDGKPVKQVETDDLSYSLAAYLVKAKAVCSLIDADPEVNLTPSCMDQVDKITECIGLPENPVNDRVVKGYAADAVQPANPIAQEAN